MNVLSRVVFLETCVLRIAGIDRDGRVSFNVAGVLVA